MTGGTLRQVSTALKARVTMAQESVGFTVKRFKDSGQGFKPGNHPIKRPL
jgi:hypothetical protein